MMFVGNVQSTKAWHHVDIPLGGKYDASRDCAMPDSCVVAKINDFSRVLTNKSATRDQRAEALKFLVHFVGDIHQPLHAVKEARGGNGIRVRFLGDERCGRYDCNLHGVWDTGMIVHTGLGRQEYSQHLENLIQSQKLGSADSGTPERWANESVGLAGAAWVRTAPISMSSIASGRSRSWTGRWRWPGCGLARLLNETIGRMTPRDFASEQRQDFAVQAATSPQPSIQKGGMSPRVKVWVNPRSMVYHRPGTEWYGMTKNGEYMTETEARQKGCHPVGGRACK